MTYLSTLTPAEVYILIKKNVTHQDLLKITFIDLLLKNVLKTYEVEKQPSAQDDVRLYKYVSIGLAFQNYRPKNHEKFFLSVFEKDNTIEILFRNLVKAGYQNSNSLYYFKNELIKTPTLNKCYSQNILQKLISSYSITPFGKELKRKVEKEIQNLNAAYSDVTTLDHQKAVMLIQSIGGSIFLLEHFNYELLNQISSDLAMEMNRHKTESDTSSCSGCSWSFTNYSSDFDSGCSSDSSSSDSGSGDSGCSSCSGCGGCS